MLFPLLFLASAGGVLVGLATILTPAERVAWWVETAVRMTYVLAFVAVTVGVVVSTAAPSWPWCWSRWPRP